MSCEHAGMRTETKSIRKTNGSPAENGKPRAFGGVYLRLCDCVRHAIIADMNDNDSIITMEEAHSAGAVSMTFGGAAAVIGGILLAMGSPVFGGVVLAAGIGVTGLGLAGVRKSRIRIPSDAPAFKVSGTVQEQLALLDSYASLLESRSNKTASHYVNTIAKLRKLLTLPEYENNAYEEDRNLIRTLIKGTSMTSSRFSEIPESINSNVRFLGMDDGKAVQNGKDNLQKIDEQLDAVDETIGNIQSHIVSNATLDVDKTSEYLKSKFGIDDIHGDGGSER